MELTVRVPVVELKIKVPVLEGKGILLAPIFCVLFVFFMPISPSLKSIFFGCAIAAILFTPHYSKHLFYAYKTIWGYAALSLFVFVLIACCWSSAPYSMRLMVVGKYFKLVSLPILAVVFINPKIRNLGINSFLAAMFITCLLSILKAIGILHIGIEGMPGQVFYNHIVTGFMMALGSYLAGLLAFQCNGLARKIYLFVMFLLSYQIIFINTGRTGYILYFVLMILLFVQIFSLKKAVMGVLLFCSLFLLSYNQSTVMHHGVSVLLNEVRLIKQNHNETSLGYRVQFHNYAKTLFATHPVIGIGTGGYKYSFSRDNPIPTLGSKFTEPHSQYWLTLSEQGIIGLLLLLFFLSSLFITSFKLKETRPILLGILTAFCIGALSDTIFCYSTAGYLLVVLSALSFGELIEKHALKKTKEKELVLSEGSNSVNAIYFSMSFLLNSRLGDK